MFSWILWLKTPPGPTDPVCCVLAVCQRQEWLVIEQRLPVILRWMVYALGAVEGRRVRRPLDPVAAWLLREHPTLLPSVPQPALLSTIRARTEVVDRMVLEEIERARLLGERLAWWSFGGGFDARWYRMPAYPDVVAIRHEVDAPDVLALKNRMLGASPFASSWEAIWKRPMPEDRWTVSSEPGVRPLVVIEASTGRFDSDALRLLLQRIRYDAPNARLIVGLPADAVGERAFRTGSLRALGFQVEEDLHVGTRGRLVADYGNDVCPGMYPFRVVRLVAREPVQVS